MLKKTYTLLLRNLTDKTNWISFILGLSLVFAYAPFSYWWIMFIAPALWFSQVDKTAVRKATKQGFIFAFGWFSSGISWVHVSIDQFGGLPLIASLSLMLVLCAYLAIFPAFSLYLSSRFTHNKQLNLWLLPAFWLISEYFRGVFLTGFPWLSLGYSQIDSPLAVYAPIIGEQGITFLILLCNILIYQLICQLKSKSIFKNRAHAIALLLFVLLTISLQQVNWLTPTNKQVKVALIQGNIQQEMKWEPEQEKPTLEKYLNLSLKNAQADIIIWPESAIPAFEPKVLDYLADVDLKMALNNSALVTGILNYNFESKQYFNSLIVVGRKHIEDTKGSYFYQHSNRYDKNHLLPIGEFVPFADLLRPIAPFFNLPMSSFSRGDYVQNNLIANDFNILPLICFEIAFPDQLRANFTANTHLLLTVSNDAWFADSHGPHQHLEIARMRALEFGRPLLRATNTGITATVDHLGKISQRIAQFKEGVLIDQITLVEGQTPFAAYGRFMHWLMPFFWLVFLSLITRLKSTESPSL